VHTSRTDSALVLEDGRIFRGRAFGAVGSSLGEVVFCTAMTGYQETLTDPSYRGQIVVQTAPQIGNTGWNDEDDESARIQVAGYVVRDPARMPSNWRSQRGLEQELARQGVVGVTDVDTRSLTRHIRARGPMRAGVVSGDKLTDADEMVARLVAASPVPGARLVDQVSTPRPYVMPAVGERRFRVAAVDLGIKVNTLRTMAAHGLETHVLPASCALDDVLAVEPDGVFLSNGPGDPAELTGAIGLTRQLLARRIPLFGICFGHQVLGLALGRETYKMDYGHRGINVPVVDSVTGRVAITAQNHGYAVCGEPGERFDSDVGRVVVSHHCPNDGTVEGLRCASVPAFSVQFHPEAAAGPHDAMTTFAEFVALMDGAR